MAGGTPANPATLATTNQRDVQLWAMSRRGILGDMKGNPDGSLSSRVGFAEGCLPRQGRGDPSG